MSELNSTNGAGHGPRLGSYANPGPSTDSRDARALLELLWRRKLLFLLVAVLVPAAAFGVASRSHKVYDAQALVAVQGTLPSVSSLLSPQQVVVPQDATQQVTAQAQLVSSLRVARLAVPRFLHPPPNAAMDLLPSIKATADTTSNFIVITASAPTARRAAAVANAFASAVVGFRRDQARAHLSTAINQVDSELVATPKSQIQATQTLIGQLQSLRAQLSANTGDAQVAEAARVPGSPSSPRLVRTVVLAAIIGILAAFGLILLIEGIDRRIRRPEELEQLTGLRVLSAVPRSAFKPKSITAADVEAFDTLRASLTFFNVDREVRSILVASPMPGDGKTTVAAELACSVARSGKEVILIDADLRRPRVESRLHIPLSGDLGLGTMIVEDIPLESGLVDVPVETWGGGKARVGAGRLRVLPSGPPPPNPSELLGSQRMKQLLGELQEISDLVIIDSSPMLRMSDTLALLELVSGTLDRDPARAHDQRLGDQSPDAPLPGPQHRPGDRRHGSFPPARLRLRLWVRAPAAPVSSPAEAAGQAAQRTDRAQAGSGRFPRLS